MKTCSSCAGPLCDFCVWFDFNGDQEGVYLGLGRCTHSEHPRPEDPAGACDDFVCSAAEGVEPEEVARHEASQRRGPGNPLPPDVADQARAAGLPDDVLRPLL